MASGEGMALTSARTRHGNGAAALSNSEPEAEHLQRNSNERRGMQLTFSPVFTICHQSPYQEPPPSFLSLPPELRTIVYKLLLLSKGDFITFKARGNKVYKPYGIHPNILGTCRSIRDEAEQILYKGNRFEFNLDNTRVTNARLAREYGLSQWPRPVGWFSNQNPLLLNFRILPKIQTLYITTAVRWEYCYDELDGKGTCIILLENPDDMSSLSNRRFDKHRGVKELVAAIDKIPASFDKNRRFVAYYRAVNSPLEGYPYMRGSNHNPDSVVQGLATTLQPLERLGTVECASNFEHLALEHSELRQEFEEALGKGSIRR